MSQESEPPLLRLPELKSSEVTSMHRVILSNPLEDLDFRLMPNLFDSTAD